MPSCTTQYTLSDLDADPTDVLYNLDLPNTAFVRKIDVLDLKFIDSDASYTNEPDLTWVWETRGVANSSTQSQFSVAMRSRSSDRELSRYFESAPLNVYSCKERTTRDHNRRFVFRLVNQNTNANLVKERFIIRLAIQYDNSMFYSDMHEKEVFVARNLAI